MNTPTTERNLWLAAFKHCEDKTPQQMWLPWDRFSAMFRQHEERDTKDGVLFSPTLYKKGAKRSKAGVQSVSCLVLDFDKGADHEQFHGDWAGFASLIYSTYSHSSERPRWRAIFPLAADVPSEDWPRVYRNLVSALACGHTDPVCRDACRIYYMPSCPVGAEPFFYISQGDFLDPNAFPDVLPPEQPKPTVAVTTGAHSSNGRIDASGLVSRALDRCHWEGRNPAGLWLACQLRDNRYSQDEAAHWLAQYQQQVPPFERVYTIDETINALEQAYSTAPRDPWEQPGREIVLGDPTITPEMLATAQEAVGRAKEDKGAPFEEPALSAIAHIRRWDAAEWMRLLDGMRKAGLSIKEIDRVFSAKNAETAPTEEEEKPNLAGDYIDACPVPKLRIPYPYVLTEDRLAVKIEMDGSDGHKGTRLRTVVNAPIIIGGRSKNNSTGDESLLLMWRHGIKNHWESRLVDRGTVTQSRLLATLGTVGFPWVEKCGKEITHYLTLLELNNRETLPVAQISTHLGWQGPPVDEAPFLLGSSLVLPSGKIETSASLDADRPDQWKPDRVMFSGAGDGEQQIVSAFRTAGGFPAWTAAIKRILPFPRCAVMFYAGFCAPLLKVFNVPNFVVDLSHSTTTGKTTSLRAAASIWGMPDESAAETLVHTWDNTRVFLERVSHVCSGVPVMLDDTKRVKNGQTQLIADAIYAVCSGRGRGRGNIKGLAKTQSWNTVLLSTGEQPATSFGQDGGARTRVLSIRGVPFGEKNEEAGKLAKATNRVLCSNYGHAAPKFLSWLMQERERWPEWQAAYEQWVEYYAAAPSTPEAGRLAAYAALVTLAGTMAHHAMPELGEFTNPMAAIWGEIAAEASDAAGGRRALQDVISWAHAHEPNFIGRRRADVFGAEQPHPHETAGRWDHSEGWEFLAFYPTVLRKVLDDLKYHPEGILVEWREAGWIDCLPGAFTKRVRDDLKSTKTPVRMVVIKREAVDAVDEG